MRDIYFKHFIEGISVSALAKELKISYHAVYQNINVGKKLLINYLNSNPFLPCIITYDSVTNLPSERITNIKLNYN